MKLFGKGSKLYSIFRMRCPRCQEGAFFTSHPYDLKNAGNTHEHCPNCGLKYSREPGFYYGAMYVAYALGVALFVTFWVSFNLFLPEVGVGWQVGVISVVSIVAAPYNYALSKIIWANLFIRFEKEKDQKVSSSEGVSGS
ncbi:MAG: DUF983 domain-containing protein [Fluviicola sp.]